MKVYDLERYLSEVPDGATLKFFVAGKPVELKTVLIDQDDSDDATHEIALLLE